MRVEPEPEPEPGPECHDSMDDSRCINSELIYS